mmetsp:Transcript_30785/g.45604  ORF Transcript_30785/g.45604 Transcript_30785/m.45604 type:complete len:241 (-) Transcript_30785:325-1047(-)
MSAKTEEKQLSFGEIMNKAGKSAVRGGVAGAAAMGANVACLMWMRTTINYQYRNGTSFPVAIRTLYADGGIPRFYRGVLPAMLQGPLSRFGDTAANTGVLTALNALDSTKDLPAGVKTIAASGAAALFRICIMPIDTVKTTMQVTGKFSNVVDKVKLGGPLTLYNGAIAAASATFVGHYPWFATVSSPVLFRLSQQLLFRTSCCLFPSVQLFVRENSKTGYSDDGARTKSHPWILQLSCF